MFGANPLRRFGAHTDWDSMPSSPNLVRDLTNCASMNLIEIRASDATDVTKKTGFVRAVCLTSAAARTLARQRYLSFMPLPARIFGMHFSIRAVRVFDCFAPVK